MNAFEFYSRMVTEFEHAWKGKDPGGSQVPCFDVIGMAWELVNILYISQKGIYLISTDHLIHHQRQTRGCLRYLRPREVTVRAGRIYQFSHLRRQWLLEWNGSRAITSFLHLFIFIFMINSSRTAGSFLFLIRNSLQLCIWHHRDLPAS